MRMVCIRMKSGIQNGLRKKAMPVEAEEVELILPRQ